MKQAVEFIRACGPFWVVTEDGALPTGRPFGVVMEAEGKIYVATGRGKAVCRQLSEGPAAILAIKPGTREWLRVTGRAAECTEISMKEKMLAENPRLTAHYSSAADENFVLFAITPEKAELHGEDGSVVSLMD